MTDVISTRSEEYTYMTKEGLFIPSSLHCRERPCSHIIKPEGESKRICEIANRQPTSLFCCPLDQAAKAVLQELAINGYDVEKLIQHGFDARKMVELAPKLSAESHVESFIRLPLDPRNMDDRYDAIQEAWEFIYDLGYYDYKKMHKAGFRPNPYSPVSIEDQVEGFLNPIAEGF